MQTFTKYLYSNALLVPALLGLILLIPGCSDSWNSPHLPDSDDEIVYQTSFQIPPKHLDPAVSYSSDESVIIDQIYEPPLGYHFLKRPYELEPVLLEKMPEIEYLDLQDNPVAIDSNDLAYSRYTFTIKPGILFQPHPAFSRLPNDQYRYHFTSAEQGRAYRVPADFPLQDFPLQNSRELTASDFLYQIKRIADPENHAPLIGFLSEYIVGMSELTEQLRSTQREGWLDLRQYSISGLQKIDKYRYSIKINGLYPQFSYWQAMHFFAPLPWEADRFYHNPGFKEKNLTLDWYPVGTGPFMLVRNNPNYRIELKRNPNFREERFPFEGEADDDSNGNLNDAGKLLPMIDRVVFSLDKELLPKWTKFLQGYYDRSGEYHGNVSQHLDQVMVMDLGGLELAPEMVERSITLSDSIDPTVFYNGFNMLDPVVGGYDDKQRKLRQAIAIAWDTEEYIDVFRNGSSLPYMGPLPPGIEGAGTGKDAINPYTHGWQTDTAQRKSIDYARQLMTEAGYPNGRDSKTGKPLKLYLDLQAQATSNSTQDWQKRQLDKLGIQLEFRVTDWNRYREKLRNGNHQLFQFGWGADYPDPENFLFLFDSEQSPLICKCDGNNVSNYSNAKFDQLFDQIGPMSPGPERVALIQKALETINRDAPFFTGYYPKEYYLNHQWIFNNKRHGVSNATMKYIRIDKSLRQQKQQQWNQPEVWPLILIILLLLMMVIPAVAAYKKRQRQTVGPN